MSLDTTATDTESNRSYDIPVTNCGEFTRDRIFTKTIKLLSPQWISLCCNCGNQEPELHTKNIDKVIFQKDKFQVIVDCRGFKSKEIHCNVTKDSVEMIAENENSDENAKEVLQRNRAMNRFYTVPQPINPDKTLCHLSSDGFLVITAPWFSTDSHSPGPCICTPDECA